MSDRTGVVNLDGYYRWHAHFYDATRWAFLFGRSALLRLCAEEHRPRRILEIGCGTGKNLAELARVFPQAEIVGLDLSAEMLGKARKKIAGTVREYLCCSECTAPRVSDGNPFGS